MKNIAIIGAGKVGTAIGYTLKKNGHTITSLTCTSLTSAEESSRIIGQGQPTVNNTAAAESSSVIFISVPDDKIAVVVSEIEASGSPWTGKTVFHCSGLHPARILKPLKDRGAATASFHPIQSFSSKTPRPGIFKKIYFGLEGDEKAVLYARNLIQDLGGLPLNIKADQKPLYHAACSISSNFLVVLLDTAISLLEAAGLDKDRASQALMPLVDGTLENVKNQGCLSALTGPAVRGDEDTLRTHLQALEAFPEVQDVYKNLVFRALTVAQGQEKLTEEKIKEVSRILGQK